MGGVEIGNTPAWLTNVYCPTSGQGRGGMMGAVDLILILILKWWNRVTERFSVRLPRVYHPFLGIRVGLFRRHLRGSS